MIKCSEECNAACDFCIYLKTDVDEDGDEMTSGICLITKEHKEFYDMCEEFHCFRSKE